MDATNAQETLMTHFSQIASLIVVIYIALGIIFAGINILFTLCNKPIIMNGNHIWILITSSSDFLSNMLMAINIFIKTENFSIVSICVGLMTAQIIGHFCVFLFDLYLYHGIHHSFHILISDPSGLSITEKESLKQASFASGSIECFQVCLLTPLYILFIVQSVINDNHTGWMSSDVSIVLYDNNMARIRFIDFLVNILIICYGHFRANHGPRQ